MFKRSIPPQNDERMYKLEDLLDLTYSDKLKFGGSLKNTRTQGLTFLLSNFITFAASKVQTINL